ncbi:hypothetical protein PHYBLDRAFT_152443 [Phycomyces blakesleeanus NRRL 1555(-)]|uniref:Uncharacterized protein n=1 Tax=Phycomyces blakesleeanus (strain ATCC 8743b / DSM 1359 / FGSC 10004 / NBRC 33097 / NRRL 1555) TaxID=763407 RepID=A0A167JNM2_PHYB8|nr:hypothetical protein PHYBLDRAFT_152443 [Phycomyces blakesleeanus NRRL 1555(-)]OAD66369.1 hypothetical protein PHYBLDRAFT_152443 [Phycomyces blakesleeanus NRRL 1555(-)]|eukprot:XP_018284409.1 hypothetical protein PHYBLDRAFT_152443 [Phycomyces blakesleeanus NRRL 1555(-)]
MNNFTSNSPSENNFVHAAIARNIMPNNNTGLTLVMYTPTMRPAGSHVDDNVADPVLAMLASLNAQMKSLTDQIASMATSITKSNDITTRLQETVANIVSGQTVVQNTASRYNVTSDIEAVTGLSSLMEDDYVPGKRYPAISIRFDLRIMVKTSNTFLIEIDQWPEWVLISYFTDGYNHGLALALTAYLQIQPQSAGILTSELACMRQLCSCPSKAAMSDGKTDDETTRSVGSKRLKAHYSSWRSDEFQTLLESLDDYAVAKEQQRSLKLIPCTRVMRDADVPNDLGQ